VSPLLAWLDTRLQTTTTIIIITIVQHPARHPTTAVAATIAVATDTEQLNALA
jgi:hypothetical protein